MRKPNLSLRARFIGACLLLVTISTAGYIVGVARFIELLENQLRDERLRGELDEFADAYRTDPAARGPHAAGLSSFVLPPGADPLGLPAPLRTMRPGVHGELHLDDGQEVAAGRADIDGARLFVVLDMSEIEAFETRFVVLAWICALGSWIAAILLAQSLARHVLRPVRQLAERVGDLHPGQSSAPLAPQFRDVEIGAIAAAFDRFIERMDAFVARERAFTEDASHELRTPLAIIDSSAQLLAEDPTLGEPSRLRLQRIQRAVQQMRTLIEALLFLAREQGGAEAEPVALDALLAELVDTHRELLAGKPVQIEVDTVPLQVVAPRGMPACVIGNLLLNAIHYTERGTIVLRLEAERLIVEDSGIGIAPTDLARIFERRYRGAQSRGNGLGLYLVKRICDRLGWQIRVSSVPGSGTCFELQFAMT